MNDLCVNLTDFGGKFDDPTFDNGPIISKALTYLDSNGGGTFDMSGHMVMIFSELDLVCFSPISIKLPKYLLVREHLGNIGKIVPEFQINRLHRYKKGQTALLNYKIFSN